MKNFELTVTEHSYFPRGQVVIAVLRIQSPDISTASRFVNRLELVLDPEGTEIEIDIDEV